MSAATLNSLFILSTMMSRCSSPMPSITVWLVSSSREKWKEGSSWASLYRAAPILSLSALLLGSMAICNTSTHQLITCSHATRAQHGDIVAPILSLSASLWYNGNLQQTPILSLSALLFGSMKICKRTSQYLNCIVLAAM